jgi:MoxR-like ATPase
MGADDAAAVRAALARAGAGLVEREVLVELVVLAAVAREHVLVVGPPGTAKSEAVRRVARVLGGRTFEYLLGRFTEPNEIFGPVDLRRLREGVVAIETAGMLPEAEIAFLDEVFQGSTAILNTLLGILNERRFRRGHTEVACPLRVCVGASNALPDEPALAAFADRFLLRAFLEPVADPLLEDLLASGWSLDEAAPPAEPLLPAIDRLADAARACDMAAVRPALAQALRTLRGAGVALSDRRAVRAQRVIAAAAVLAGRARAGEADLWPLVYVVPGAEAQALAREALGELLAASANAALGAAAEDASRGPLARAARLCEAGRALLAAGDGDDGWRRRLEGLAREIDAGFAAEAMPADLAALRREVAARLEPPGEVARA